MTTERTPDSDVGAVLRRNIDRRLAEIGWTPKDLYEAIGMAPSSYSWMFKAAAGPKLATLQKIAEELECDLSELVE